MSMYALFLIGEKPQIAFATHHKGSEKLAFMQQMVDGYIERVPIKIGEEFSKIVKNIWVNEEGLIRKLSPNFEATDFIHCISSQKLHFTLVGNVLIELKESQNDMDRELHVKLAELMKEVGESGMTNYIER